VLLLLLSGRALAQEVDGAARAAARKLGYAGVEAYQANEYKEALDKLDKAYRVLKAPSLGLWSARALLANGRLVEASERYLEVTRLSVDSGERAVQERAKADARKELDALTPRIPSVVIRLEGAFASDVTLTIDGVAVSSALVGEGRPTDPGKHRIEGTRGSERVQAEVTLREREEKAVVLRFNPSELLSASASGGDGTGATSSGTVSGGLASGSGPGADGGPGGGAASRRSSGSAARTMGWVSIGIGAAGAGVGVTTGILALQKKKDIEVSGDCVGGCKNTGRVQNFNTLRITSIVSSVGAGVLVVTGVALLIAAPSDDDGVALLVGPGEAHLRLSF
jgi:hypothetical protein